MADNKRKTDVSKPREWCSKGSTEKQTSRGLLELTQDTHAADAIPNLRRGAMYLGGFENKGSAPRTEELLNRLVEEVREGKGIGEAKRIRTQEEFCDELDAKLRELESESGKRAGRQREGPGNGGLCRIYTYVNVLWKNPVCRAER